ncbi:MAG: cation transporter [Coriobacteriia bacterium]|nr:cation transporter [Coriobacteriia bacterium]
MAAVSASGSVLYHALGMADGGVVSDCGCEEAAERLERDARMLLLAINATTFAIEGGAGLLAHSAGLLADSLDMLADAGVYGLALAAVGRAERFKIRAASASGVLQTALGLSVLAETVRKAIVGSEPRSALMMAVGVLALAANAWCLSVIAKHRDGGVHMRASWIFSVNDVLANLGVITAGVLVALLRSPVPDLVAGGAISALVIRGGLSIMADVRRERAGQAAACCSDGCCAKEP